MGVLAAFIFAAQAINFPVAGGTSVRNAKGSALSMRAPPLLGRISNL